MGGLDTKENIVVLTAREHYIAHLLLTKITKGANKKKMAFALWNMVNRDNGKRTINCFDVVEQKFVRICANIYNLNKDRYKNNNSKEAKKLKESRDVK